eukprot:CAMPEP_0113454722 /NCGR_PEP_ID=MMETSP0014_2-20120614/8010_1 /TAXON_ID=2857 /ORGANISM="Nitzschia sp." /LENGTH=298 /DNA_ID=CAMNT_0000346137 /DNA_START=230 /DNA_END=1126 /DNA_ORIENTATION=+ /assembly_acc=CAM_ASM_000159
MKRRRRDSLAVVVAQSTATTLETETKEGTTSTTTTTTTKELGVLAEDEDKENDEENENDDPLMVELEDVDTMEVKRRLLDLVPKMMGTADEFKQVEAYVNTLEQRYQSIQTLDFLNLALEGEWQLLFSTNLSNVRPKPYFRLRELCQNIQTDNLQGSIANVATWDLANDYDQDEDGSTAPPGAAAAASTASTAVFDSSGTFSAKCSYSINQGARMVVDFDDHVLELAKGSSVPKDVENLVGLLHRSIPKELFDPAEHAIDTTYLDADLRIARMTGPRLEGVRDIFIRRNSIEINPGLS